MQENCFIFLVEASTIVAFLDPIDTFHFQVIFKVIHKPSSHTHVW